MGRTCSCAIAMLLLADAPPSLCGRGPQPCTAHKGQPGLSTTHLSLSFTGSARSCDIEPATRRQMLVHSMPKALVKLHTRLKAAGSF